MQIISFIQEELRQAASVLDGDTDDKRYWRMVAVNNTKPLKRRAVTPLLYAVKRAGALLNRLYYDMKLLNFAMELGPFRHGSDEFNEFRLKIPLSL